MILQALKQLQDKKPHLERLGSQCGYCVTSQY